jgi:hypothetical protein
MTLRTCVTPVFLAVAALGQVPARLAAQASAPAERLARLEWMAGCWEGVSGPRVVEEHWTRPRAGLMLGASRTVQGDSLVEFEQVKLLERGGRLVFAAAPSRQAPAEFVSIAVSDSSATFENLAHDFPQRIIYRRIGRDSLLARVEGTQGGQLRGRDFPYRRTECP